jgi:hypothetical protein
VRKVALLYTVLLLSLAIAGLMGCGEEAEEAVEKAGTGPSIFNTIPKNGAENVPTTAAIVVTFDREVITPSVANLTFTPAVSGDVSYDSDTRTLVFKPSAPLSNNADYSITIDGITDLEGNSMSPATINFTTSVPDKTRPEVTLTSPEDGQKDVIHDTNVLIRFSESIDRTRLWSGISFDPRIDLSSGEWPLEWGVGDYEEVTIYPPMGVEPFEPNKEYTLQLSSDSVMDLSGNSMVTDYKLKFHTLKYPVEKIEDLSLSNPMVDPDVVEPKWFYIVGRVGGSRWVVIWGGKQPPGAPSQNTPSGTITASADGEILGGVEGTCINRAHNFTPTVSKGKGNRLTYQTTNMNNTRRYQIIFSSTSSYLTFDLRSAAGTIPKQYVHIGSERVHPSGTPFMLRNK